MVTTTPTRAAPGRAAPASNGRVTATLGRPRRNPLFIVAGAFLVVVLALAFMSMQLRSEQSVSVLVVARPVPAGQTITAADLRVASVVQDSSVPVVAESQADTVVGRTAAVPLVAGALLSPNSYVESGGAAERN
jgi:Flp pilus assembly protein CpaB